MATRTYKKIDSKGREETWEWEETPEVVAAVKQLHATIALNKLRLEELK
jgi:hypothetical protein|tara:strand:- start:140 stop:286 length:147 start_codon:yes stop_codon:yes gene_type:complete